MGADAQARRAKGVSIAFILADMEIVNCAVDDAPSNAKAAYRMEFLSALSGDFK